METMVNAMDKAIRPRIKCVTVSELEGVTGNSYVTFILGITFVRPLLGNKK